MDESEKKYDVIIIGGGAAGLSAALWCDELGLSALLLEKSAEFGGQLLRVYNEIKNHLGTETASGREMRDIFVRQTEKRRFAKRLDSPVSFVDAENKTVSLQSGEKFFSRALIIATGVSRRKLNVEGEDDFAGKGILESGKKDGETVADKTVAVVGGGDAALENALILAETAAKVYLIHRRADFGGRNEFLEKVARHSKIEIITESVVRRIVGDETVNMIEIENPKSRERKNLPIDFVLIRIGVEPNTKKIIDGSLELDDAGYIKIDGNCETSAKTVFAVGDVANPIAPTVSSAVGMGATAAKSIFALLNSK